MSITIDIAYRVLTHDSDRMRITKRKDSNGENERLFIRLGISVALTFQISPYRDSETKGNVRTQKRKQSEGKTGREQRQVKIFKKYKG